MFKRWGSRTPRNQTPSQQTRVYVLKPLHAAAKNSPAEKEQNKLVDVYEKRGRSAFNYMNTAERSASHLS